MNYLDLSCMQCIIRHKIRLMGKTSRDWAAQPMSLLSLYWVTELKTHSSNPHTAVPQFLCCLLLTHYIQTVQNQKYWCIQGFLSIFQWRCTWKQWKHFKQSLIIIIQWSNILSFELLHHKLYLESPIQHTSVISWTPLSLLLI